MKRIAWFLILAAIMLPTASPALAGANAADPTFDKRVSKSEFQKVVLMEGGDFITFRVIPLSDLSSCELFYSKTQNGKVEEFTQIASTRLSPKLDFAMVNSIFDRANNPHHTLSLAGDFRSSKVSVGLLKQVHPSTNLVIGPRVPLIDKFTGYTNIAKGQKPKWGLGYLDRVTSVDLTYVSGSDCWILWILRAYPGITPEIRVVRTKDSTTIGFAISIFSR